jgi:hypothetical protein
MVGNAGSNLVNKQPQVVPETTFYQQLAPPPPLK